MTNIYVVIISFSLLLWPKEIELKIRQFSYKKMHLKMECRLQNSWPFCSGFNVLTYWGRVTHLCVSKLTSIASDNGLSPGRRQAIIWNNAGILLIGPLGTNCSEILIEIQTFSLKKISLKISSAKCRPFRPGFSVLSLPQFSAGSQARNRTPVQLRSTARPGCLSMSLSCGGLLQALLILWHRSEPSPTD